MADSSLLYKTYLLSFGQHSRINSVCVFYCLNQAGLRINVRTQHKEHMAATVHWGGCRWNFWGGLTGTASQWLHLSRSDHFKRRFSGPWILWQKVSAGIWKPWPDAFSQLSNIWKKCNIKTSTKIRICKAAVLTIGFASRKWSLEYHQEAAPLFGCISPPQADTRTNGINPKGSTRLKPLLVQTDRHGLDISLGCRILG